MPTRWRHVTPHTAAAPAAIGVIHLAGNIDGALVTAKLAPVRVGGVALRHFGDIDRGVVARPGADTLLLMPHAGPAVLRRLSAWLDSLGFVHADIEDPRALYPEASSLLEARMLHALARAASPLAIDLLLDQPRRWAGAGGAETDPEVVARSAILNRLIDPPTIVALGPPNIGKSTLLNTLAGRSVSIVADEPGTTRDHVGVRLDLAGLVVGYLDTPGIDPAGARDEVQREAQEIALVAAPSADLVLLCGDSTAGFAASPAGAGAVVRIALRSDLGAAPGADLRVSARTGAGIDALVAALRERLVPAGALGHAGPWRFW